MEVIEYNKLSVLADNLWSRKLTVSASRGRILDRNGKVIVGNESSASLAIVPSQIEDKEYAITKLSEILNVTYEEMESHINKKVSIEKVHPIGRDLTNQQVEKIEELNISGVYLLKESKRSYDYPTTLSHVIGFAGIDNQGLSGLELMYDDYLKGTDGYIKYYADGKGHKLNNPEVFTAPTNGNDITLTIDLNLQLAVENELSNALAKYNTSSSMAIVMKVKTGEILALASTPTFNIKNYQDYSLEIINRNLPIFASFEPGSTFKILTLAAAINEGKVNIFEDKYYDTGKINVEGTTLHCWKSEGHKDETFLEVVENSCNPGFVVLGQRLGKETLFNYIDKFGFGYKTGIDLNGESKGIIFDIEKVGPLELATTSFGQGISVTAMQQVKAVSSIINNGNMYTPYIVSKITDNNQNIVKEVLPKLEKEKLISEETSKLVRYALESVVAKGTGHNAYVENYRVGGKTGTAQKVGENGSYIVGDYILSFIGFMPANDPEYIVYVALDGAHNVSQYGGTTSAPIAKSIFEEMISLYNLKEDNSGLPREYEWYETKYITLNDVVGKTKEEAKKELTSFRIEYTGSGDVVVSMNPKAGTRVKEGSSVKLMLN